MVTELLRGPNFADYIHEQFIGVIKEDKAANITYQILLALNYCHDHGIIHRDLKMENIMFAEKSCKTLKIIDFGLAQIMSNQLDKEFAIYGTPVYTPPEIISKMPYTTKSDIWSCGIILYTLLSGNHPYKLTENTNQAMLFAEIQSKVFSKEEDMNDNYWDLISEKAKGFLLKMLENDPSKRATASDLFYDKWLLKKVKRDILPKNTEKIISSLERKIVC